LRGTRQAHVYQLRVCSCLIAISWAYPVVAGFCYKIWNEGTGEFTEMQKLYVSIAAQKAAFECIAVFWDAFL
jgi:hypothetical protein